MASNSYGQWNDSEAAISLEVDPAYWQTWWFRASCVAAFLTLLWALYQLRLRQVARQFQHSAGRARQRAHTHRTGPARYAAAKFSRIVAAVSNGF